MNILKRELRTGLKPFIFWSIGIFILIFVGMIKFEGISTANGSSITDLMDKFPRIVLAILGMVDVNVNSLGGYYSILSYYGLICAVIYAVHLGSNAVSRETIDQTYEFIFTKPRSRSYILSMKLRAAWIYFALFCALSYVFAVSATSTLQISEDLNSQMLLFSISIFLIGSIFLALSAFFSAIAKQAEKGSLYGNLFFLYSFIIGIIYDMLENGGVLKFISPLKYFNPADILTNKLDPLFVVICVILTGIFLINAFRKFNKRDLSEK